MAGGRFVDTGDSSLAGVVFPPGLLKKKKLKRHRHSGWTFLPCKIFRFLPPTPTAQQKPSRDTRRLFLYGQLLPWTDPVCFTTVAPINLRVGCVNGGPRAEERGGVFVTPLPEGKAAIFINGSFAQRSQPTVGSNVSVSSRASSQPFFRFWTSVAQ